MSYPDLETATAHCLEITKFALDGSNSRSTLPSIRRKVSRDRSFQFGHEVQDPQHLYFVRAWDTSNALHGLPKEFSSRPSRGLDVAPGALEYNIHVHLSCEPYTALAAPVTEIVLWTLRDGAPRSKVEELLSALMKIVNAIPFSKGMYKAGWGPVVNDPTKFVVLIGWSSMEAFELAVQNSPDGRALLDELAKVTERLLRHVILEHPREHPTYEARL